MSRAIMDLSRREPRKINGGNNMSNATKTLLDNLKATANDAAGHALFWDENDGELMPDLYQVQLALETLQRVRAQVARAELQLESLIPAAREAARLEYQGGVNRG